MRSDLKDLLVQVLLVSKFYGQAMGLISTGQLSAFRYTRLHFQPINLVVYKESHWQD